MGRGNVCVYGKYEGLYYVDRDYLDWYTSKEPGEDGAYECMLLGDMDTNDFNDYDYDLNLSQDEYDEFIDSFISIIKKKFKSFEVVDSRYNYGVILENNLFEIEIEDNVWSYAVKLIQKEPGYYDNGSIQGLQAKHYKNYLEGIKYALLELFPSIGCYSGAWTSGTITREDIA